MEKGEKNGQKGGGSMEEGGRREEGGGSAEGGGGGQKKQKTIEVDHRKNKFTDRKHKKQKEHIENAHNPKTKFKKAVIWNWMTSLSTRQKRFLHIYGITEDSSGKKLKLRINTKK